MSTVKPDVEVEDVAMPSGNDGRVMVRIFRPADIEGGLPVVLCLQDPPGPADWMARELARTERVAVLVPESTSDIETVRGLLGWIVAEGARRRLDGARIEVMGDGMAAELAIRAQVPLRSGPTPPEP